jgi:hypothetical protein
MDFRCPTTGDVVTIRGAFLEWDLVAEPPAGWIASWDNASPDADE